MQIVATYQYHMSNYILFIICLTVMVTIFQNAAWYSNTLEI